MNIRFYLTDVTQLNNAVNEGYSLLTVSRRQRMDQMLDSGGKLRIMGAGLLLRSVLSLCDDAQLSYGVNGKPFLADGPHFSLSHSGKWCALAVSDTPVGVDIEAPREVSDGMYRRCLTNEEFAWCHGNAERFLQLWTRKESIMKACGIGLGMGLRSISALPGTKTAAGGKLWMIETFQMDGCICSVACENDFDLQIQRIPAVELLRN